MIDGGLVLFLVAAFIALMTPAERALARRLHHVEHPIPPLAAAYRFATPAPSLDELAARAEAALDAVDLTRGVRDVAGVYQRAGRARRT